MSDFGKLRRYLAIPSRSTARIAREVREELRLHIDMRAEALERTGMSPVEARAQATREFGDLDDATRYCSTVDRTAERRRGASNWMSEIRHDVAHALRMLRRGPAFAAATVLTLALALGASTAVYGVLHTYLVRPLPFPDSDRLVFVWGTPTLDRFPNAPSLDGVDWRFADSLFARTVSWDIDGFTLVGEPHAENVTGAWITEGYFPLLGVRPAVGRAFLPEEYREQAPVAIISHALWQRRFAADPGVIGSTMTAHSIDRSEAGSMVTIVGVMAPDFWPIHWRESQLLRPWPMRNEMPVLAQLRPGVSKVETQRRLDAGVRAQIGGAIDPAWHMSLVPALELHSGRARPLLRSVFGAAAFILLAACASVAGALVSRMAARRSELAIRLALGGSRARIIRQLLTESAVLATLAGVLGMVIAYVLLSLSGTLVERQLGISTPGGTAALRPTASIMVASLLASVACGLALGLVPALTFLRLDRSSSASATLGSTRGSAGRTGGARVRRVLIAGQVTVAMVLLFGAGLMLRTIARIDAIDLGFRAQGLVKGTVMFPIETYPDSTAKRQLLDRVLTRVGQAEGVRSAAAAYPYPFRCCAGAFPVLTEGQTDEAAAPRAGVHTVTPGYFETMNVVLRAGRDFRPTDDPAAPLVVIVSETLARRISPDGNVLGRRLRVRIPYLANFNDVDARPWRTIVGVVAEVKEDLTPDEPPDVYAPYAQNPRTLIGLVVRTSRDESSVLVPVKRALASVDPALVLQNAGSMSDLIAEAGGQRRGLTILLGAFAAFALGLAALALYASLSYTVVQRRSELAVRMAVGAGARSILRLVVAEGLMTAAIGVVTGIAASLALGRVLENQLYEVGTADAATLVSISAVLTVAAIVACLIPGVRATRTDPALVLRE